MVTEIVMIVLLLLAITAIGYCGIVGDEDEIIKDMYQGPVPLGYDVEHFRETGETTLEVIR